MAKLTVRDINTNGKRVFARVDYNVPLEEKDGQMVITDETRKEMKRVLDEIGVPPARKSRKSRPTRR